MHMPMKAMALKLPADLQETARQRAKAEGISLSEYIRQSIAQANQAKGSHARHPVLDAPTYDGPMPRDGSVNLDRYIYRKRRR